MQEQMRAHSTAINHLSAALAKWIELSNTKPILASIVNAEIGRHDQAYKARFSALELNAKVASLVQSAKNVCLGENRAQSICEKYKKIDATNVLPILIEIFLTGNFAPSGHSFFGYMGVASLNTDLMAQIVAAFKQHATEVLSNKVNNEAEFDPGLLVTICRDLDTGLVKPDQSAKSIFEQANASIRRAEISHRRLSTTS